MKKVLLIALSVCLCAFMFTACDGAEAVKLEVSGTAITDGCVLKGTELTSNIKYKLKLDDGTESSEISVTADMIEGYDKNVTGKQTVTISKQGFDYEFDVIVADKIIKNQIEFDALQADRDAVTNLTKFTENECIAFTAGTYSIARVETFTAATPKTSLGKTNFYIATDGVSIYGAGEVKFTAEVGTVAREQSAIFIDAENVTIDGISMSFAGLTADATQIYPKLITVETNGDKCVISNCTFTGGAGETVTGAKFDSFMAVYFNATGTTKYLVKGNNFNKCRLYIANGTGTGGAVNDSTYQIVQGNIFTDGAIAMVGITDSGWDVNATNYPKIENNIFNGGYTMVLNGVTGKDSQTITKTFQYAIGAFSSEGYNALLSETLITNYKAANGLSTYKVLECLRGTTYSMYLYAE